MFEHYLENLLLEVWVGAFAPFLYWCVG